jgi:hypothetical protein
MSKTIKPSPMNNKENVTQAIDTQSKMLMIVFRCYRTRWWGPPI